MNTLVEEFIPYLSEGVSRELTRHDIGITCEIESDDFILTFMIEDDIFEIRNIYTRDGNGLGTTIVICVHTFADEHDLDVIASNVVTTAEGFWRKMGYQESSTSGEFVRTL